MSAAILYNVPKRSYRAHLMRQQILSEDREEKKQKNIYLFLSVHFLKQGFPVCL